jgi:hypothetical protein
LFFSYPGIVPGFKNVWETKHLLEGYKMLKTDFPSLEEFATKTTEDRIQAMLGEMFEKKDGALFQMLCKSGSSLVKILVRWSEFKRLAIRALYDADKREWREANPPKKYREATLEDLLNELVPSTTSDEEQRGDSNLVVLKAYAGVKGILPEIVCSSLDHAMAFRGLLAKATSHVKAFSKNDGTTTHAYLEMCREIMVDKLFPALNSFLKEGWGCTEEQLRIHRSPQPAFRDVVVDIRGTKYGELLAFKAENEWAKNSFEFSAEDVSRLARVWGMGEIKGSDEKTNEKSSAGPDSLLTEVLLDSGANSQEIAMKMALAVEKHARKKGLSLDEALRAKAVNKQLEAKNEELDPTALVYAKAGGLSQKKLLKQVSAKREQLEGVSSKQAERDAKRKTTMRESNGKEATKKNKGKEKQKKGGKKGKK